MGLKSRLKHLKPKHLIGGLVGVAVGTKKEEERAKKEAQEKAQKAKEKAEREAELEAAKPEMDYTAIEEQLAARPEYEIPSEVAEFKETMGAKAGQIEDISFAGAGKIREEAGIGARRVRKEASFGARRMRDLGQQYADIYQTRAGRTEMPGSGIMETQARTTTGAYLSALERFGASPASIGQAFRAESQALQNIAIQNAQYRDRAQTDYAQALMGQAGLERQATGLLTSAEASATGLLTGAEASATGMQTGALATGAEMIGRGQMMGAKYADQAYQLNELSPYYDKLNLETMKASNLYAQQMAEYQYQRDLELGEQSLEAYREIAEEQNKGWLERWGDTSIGDWF